MGSLADPAIMRQKHENLKAKRGSLNRRPGSQEKPTSTPLIAKLLTSPHLHQYSNEQVQKNVRVHSCDFDRGLSINVILGLVPFVTSNSKEMSPTHTTFVIQLSVT